MKSTKNLKPVYAVNLGNGVFAGVMWMCIICGKQFNYNSSAPSPCLETPFKLTDNQY